MNRYIITVIKPNNNVNKAHMPPDIPLSSASLYTNTAMIIQNTSIIAETKQQKSRLTSVCMMGRLVISTNDGI